jgi:hypothetical protein
MKVMTGKGYWALQANGSELNLNRDHLAQVSNLNFKDYKFGSQAV